MLVQWLESAQGPNDDLIMDKSYKDSPGRFSFTSEVPGEHVICLHTTAGWFGAQLMVCALC
jgi:hypothetical protein